MQINLLDETLSFIDGYLNTHYGITRQDIVYIGSTKSGHRCTLEEFTKLADRTYNNRSLYPQVADDLKIVFKDHSFMSRTIRSAEWWTYNTKELQSQEVLPIKSLFIDPEEPNLNHLADIN